MAKLDARKSGSFKIGGSEQLEVDVILGPRGPTKHHPQESGTPTRLLAEGRLVDDCRVWLVYTIKPVMGAWGTITGSGHIAPESNGENGELPGIGAGVESDGSLRFVERRVRGFGTNGHPEIYWGKD